LPECAE